MQMLTLDKFEEASEKVKEVTLETKLVYSDSVKYSSIPKFSWEPVYHQNQPPASNNKIRAEFINTIISKDPHIHSCSEIRSISSQRRDVKT